ncbi:MAG: hypothetical protein E7523_12350 [Ruminococcaceae bacterium]|nr:hypothetical protein [Oscillospiraceae bacterium]
MKKITVILLSLLLVLAAPLGIFADTDLPDAGSAFAPNAQAVQVAETGDVKIETDWVIDARGCIAVKVYFVDAVDLKSWTLWLTYDADIFDFAHNAVGADAQQVQKNCDEMYNAFTDESNPSVDGKIEGGGYFKDVLWPAEDFLAASLPGKECIINDEKFEAAVFYLEVEDVNTYKTSATTISIEGSMTFVEGKKVSDSVTKETSVLLGDIDGDGHITAGDARLALRASVKLESFSNQQKHIGDVDKDNIITAGDARLILRWSVGMPEDK